MNKVIINKIADITEKTFENNKDIIVFHLNEIITNQNIDINIVLEEILKVNTKYLGIVVIGLYNQTDFNILNIDDSNYKLDKFCQENNFIFMDYDYDIENKTEISIGEYIESCLVINADYNFFSNIYNNNQIEIDYTKWKEIIDNHIKNYNTILDISCGTAPYVNLFDSKKYLGIDLSNDMIKIAKRANPDYEFVKADMTEFVYEADVVISFLDGINYLNNDYDLNKFMKVLSDNLKEIAVIDIHDLDKVEKFDDYFYYEEYDNGIFKWESRIIGDLLIHLFTYEKNNKILVEKHVQKLYSIKDIEIIANKYQLELQKCYDVYDHNVLVLARIRS